MRESGGLPILGICLGHQGIASALGGKVNFVPEILHGQKTKISHNGKGLFRGVPQGVEMVTYNSLTVDRKSTPTCSPISAGLVGLPVKIADAPTLFSGLPDELEVTAWMTDDEETVMGLAHKSKPVFGVQFHPEVSPPFNHPPPLRLALTAPLSVSLAVYPLIPWLSRPAQLSLDCCLVVVDLAGDSAPPVLAHPGLVRPPKLDHYRTSPNGADASTLTTAQDMEARGPPVRERWQGRPRTERVREPVPRPRRGRGLAR